MHKSNIIKIIVVVIHEYRNNDNATDNRSGNTDIQLKKKRIGRITVYYSIKIRKYIIA
ncbi:Putative uncharacterized protein [Moritella viscosa]|nr:Putative uncharacterized protein [Moritella viscosa]SHO01670.1 Putative uncharacterized protein [Moritella viscosa]